MSGPASRRGLILGLATIPLTGTIIGAPLYRATGPDLTCAAQWWLRDAYALGMCFILSPDGLPFRVIPLNDGEARSEARIRHWIALNSRPRLWRAVMVQVRRGFRAWEGGE